RYIIIGDTGVGKSCLLLQFTDKRFQQARARARSRSPFGPGGQGVCAVIAHCCCTLPACGRRCTT
ncbi:GTPase Rab2, partial [Emiliania huxleyi CCMP1516]|uniref:Uncharacterized protein n=2 Tax=Emiliania huxleyi TaxID=2903 RepID=A0A0D3IP36_EMIH1